MLAGQRQQALTFDPLAEDPALELMRGLIVGVSSPAPRPCLSAAAGPLAQGLVAKPAPAAVALQAQALARSRPPD